MANDVNAQLAALSRGFRKDYLRHEDISAQLDAWRGAFPELVSLTTIGTTHEGREIRVVTIGRDPERERPSVWVDGNMHATEVCGSSVALAIAEDAIALHAGATPESAAKLPGVVVERLRDVVFHVLPRMSPDGAEAVLTTGRYVRSVPRDEREHKRHPRWISGDVDGDGLALLMRVRDDAGEYVESKDVAGLMLPRALDDEGPFFRLYPEGHIEHYDGANVPLPFFLADNDPDLNRNFPGDWRPEPFQVGAGRFALSEPESRAVVEYTVARPHIYAWLNLHTFGGCFIRPAGDKPDHKMDQEDLAVYREIGEWCEAITTYPMVSGFEEFTYEPENPLRGDLSEWAYVQRGCVAYVCELWDLFHQLGKARPKRFVDHYVSLTRDDLVKLARFDAEHNASRVFRPWKKVKHPQLGDVEVGGMDPRVGISNPPLEKLGDVCRVQSQAWLRTSALLPRLRVTKTERVSLGGGVQRVDVTVENDGYLASYGLASAKKIPWNEPLWAEATPHGGLMLATPSETRQELGHLEGWGRGKGSGASAVWFDKSKGSTSRRTARFAVTGTGVLEVRIGSVRTGEINTRIEVA